MTSLETILRSLEAIEARIAEKLTVESIAAGAYFSKFHYQRLFRQAVGRSVMDYVTKRKLTLAGNDLLESDLTILDIALKYGFETHEGFTRSFKTHMGATPSDYRKYGLTIISTNTPKEKSVMRYTKATDEIIRQLNELIVSARQAADSARKPAVPQYIPFWTSIADTADSIADRAGSALKRVSAMADASDDITGRFTVIKIIDEIAFSASLLAFNVGLMISRGQPDHIDAQSGLRDKFSQLALLAGLKAEKIAAFLAELASLILEDMRQTAADKITSVITAGRAAEEGITGYSYIKDEIEALVRDIEEAQIEKITLDSLENYLFKLDIIFFAAEMDSFRAPQHNPMFIGLAGFKESLRDAIGFFEALTGPQSQDNRESESCRLFKDIAFQGNILLFYIKGEISREKLGHILDGSRREAFEQICTAFNDTILRIHRTKSAYEFADIAYDFSAISAALDTEAEKLGPLGGAVAYLAAEVGKLASSARKIALE